MKKIAIFSLIIALCTGNAGAVVAPMYAPSDFVAPVDYNIMQSFMTPQMQRTLRPDTASFAPNPSPIWSRAAVGSGNAPVSEFVQASGPAQASPPAIASKMRRVVSRNSRAATQPRNANVTAAGTYPVTLGDNGLTARAANPSGMASQRVVVPRGGVARSATSSGGVSTSAAQQRKVVARATRGEIPSRGNNTEPGLATISGNAIATTQCLADYRTCMNSYCKRENTPYNRCFCSAQLAQIEATYRPVIEDILQRLIIIKNGGKPGTGMSDQELEQFWQDTFGNYTGYNSLASLNEALNIDWPDEENTMRGQNAFVIGHDYCMQHLKGCFYMASNLRDAYRSEIARDCQIYETYLNQIKLAGESVLSQLE
ncbi:MAG: hypothetical protein FWE50_02770 [Alphaproteobacteria bacterium]|nr:hypothetical protein [Alphaproteobacteria bacterium]